ncbi:MAG: hypothetical protein CHACPFDD_03832 [Phycisphaerae bacterium]|nr:hypothetical protein [Phycisphaerae bacterium]
MNIVPIIIDSSPGFLPATSPTLSLGLLPLGSSTVLEHLVEEVRQVSAEPLTILTQFEPSAAYAKAVQEHCPRGVQIMPDHGFNDLFVDHEPSDWLLLIEPRYFPSAGYDLRGFTRSLDTSWVARHLVPLLTSLDGTKEYVQLDAERRVRRIQRYYDGFTRLQGSGVSVSLVPVAATLLGRDLCFASLSELRRTLAGSGVPCQDVSCPGGMVDLGDERGYLALSERFLRSPDAGAAPPARPATAEIAPDARILGPVAIQQRVIVEPGATIIGPSVLGQGCIIRRHAMVAHSVVTPAAIVDEGELVRQRVHCGPDSSALDAGRARAARRARGMGAVLSGAPSPVLAFEHDAHSRVYPLLKRGVDVVVALAALLILSPLLALTALAVKLTSPGPVLFGHRREGRHGEPFHCWKFRTMVPDAHAQQRALYSNNQVDGPQFKLERDPRVTRIGRLLRASNIDELPQLINVLTGEMSLIGPRPSPFRENQICVPWRIARLSVRPGITGLWQVCRDKRAASDFHQWIYYDMLYVRHVSLALDLKILLATIVTAGGRWGFPVGRLLPRSAHQHESRAHVAHEHFPILTAASQEPPWRREPTLQGV